MRTNAERKFINLRKRLDQLGYRQPLGIETLPLVKKLFRDLVHTTESLRNAKLNTGKMEKESRNLYALLEPYKTENAELVQENNELHLGLLKLGEEKDRVSRELKAYIRKLNHETSDLKFLNNQYVHKARSQDKDSKAKTERVQQLQENMQALVQTPGGKKHSISFRRQRMQIDELIPPSSGPTQTVVQPDDLYIADLLQVADDRIQELQQDITKLKLDLERALGGIKHLNIQVEERDKEIEHLSRALDGGHPHDVISLEAQTISTKKRIAHLNLQIEYLQETNRTLEQKVQGLQQRKQDASTEVADLSAKNQELCQAPLTPWLLSLDKELELESMRSKHGVCGKDRSPSRLDTFVRNLEEERDYYRQEAKHYHREPGGMDLSPTCSSQGRGRSPRGRAGWHGTGDNVDLELSRTVKERDELQAVLLGFERHMEDIQTSVKALTAERDQLSEQCQQLRKTGQCTVQKELRQTQRGSELSTEVLSLKKEREQADTDLQRITPARETLRESLKVAQTCTLTNREEEERRILNLENTIKTLEREQLDLRSQVSVLKEGRVAVEEELKVRSTALVQTVEETAQQRAQSSALRLLQEQMEQSLFDIQHRLSVKTNEVHAAHQQIEKLEEKIGELSRNGSTQREELTVLQKTISVLDKEKDPLQDDVDQKTESLALLQDELSRREKTLEEVRLTVTDMENSLNQLKGALSSREREIASLHRQLNSAQEELSGVRRDREITLRENRRLQDDLATMTRENQAVHVEMEEALHEKDELKMRVHSYISEVARIENMMIAKEQENGEMLEQFRMAHGEDRELKLQHAKGLNNSIPLELLSSETERRHLMETGGHQEREFQVHMSAQQAYEAQVSSLARGMSQLEEALQAAQEEKTVLLSDLASVRELCVKLDSSKEFSTYQFTSKSMELERVTGELEDVRSEAELLKKQLASERLTVRNLETLLSSNRQKEFHTHLSASERESEVKVMRDRLALADSKTEGHAREVSQLQTDIDVLKRQLTTERFERERVVQEMHRQGVSFSSLCSSSPLSRSLSPRLPAPEHSILQTPERSTDRNVSFKE